MNKTLSIRGIKRLYEVHCHLEEVSFKKWLDKRYGFPCSEHVFRAYYTVGCYRFSTTYIVRFGSRVIEIWFDALGNRVYSEKKCLESFID